MANFAWWLQALWQPFKWTTNNTHAHSGVDLGMPCGSQLVSPVNGTVVSTGQEAWGGQVNILVPAGQMPAGYDQSSPYVLSFLHMQRIDVGNGAVSQGQQIGLSGQPPPGYGKGCHLHYEVTHGNTPPYMGYSPWYPTATSYPQDPAPFLSAMGNRQFVTTGPNRAGIQPGPPPAPGSGGQLVNTIGQPTGTTLQFAALQQGATQQATPAKPGQWCFSILGSDICIPVLRVGKLILGTVLVLVGTLLFAIPTFAPPVLQGAGIVSGQPALVAAGAAMSGRRRGQSRPERAAERSIQTNQAAMSIAQARQTGNLEKRRAEATKPLSESDFTSTEPARKNKPGRPAPGEPGTKEGVGSLVNKRNPAMPLALAPNDAVRQSVAPVGHMEYAAPSNKPTLVRGPATSFQLPKYTGAREFYDKEKPVTAEEMERRVKGSMAARDKQLAEAKERRQKRGGVLEDILKEFRGG